MTKAISGSVALGLSGATVRDGGDGFVAKYGDEKVSDQGHWLMTHAARGLVDVRHVNLGLGSYTMERLKPMPHRIVHPTALAQEICFILRRDVWYHMPEVEPDWVEHNRYIQARVDKYAPRLKNKMLGAAAGVHNDYDAGKIETCLVHGDPTFANAMLRGADVVLIDPIPATSHMPSLKAVDLGKIVQSLLGFEQLVFGWHPPVHVTHGNIVEFINSQTVSPEETAAVWYFAACHILRLMPYAEQHSVNPDDLMELLDGAAIWL